MIAITNEYNIAVFLIFLFLTSCITLKPVEVKNVDNLQLTVMTSQPAVQFDVNIHNPNNFGLTLKEFQSTAFLGDKRLTDIFISKKLRIGANSDVSIPLQTQPSLNDVAGMLLSGNSSKDVKVDGYLTVRKFIFKKKFPFSVRTKL